MEIKQDIFSINVDGIGEIFAEKRIEHYHDKNQPQGTYRIERNPILAIEKNGEMAPVIWYRQGNREYNGKYVREITYYN